jgi:glycosyltransferase involved in cell wall biosynthesis
LTDAKGTREAVVAFAKSGVAEDGYALKLIGACTEEYRKSLDETICEYEVADSVEYVPLQKDVKPYLEKATGYIMTSKYEGMGRTTAEAMFYGCPVITHASGGTLDMVKDGETGNLYETIDECAELIKKACATNQEEMILRAQEFAINNLSQEAYGPKIIEVYKQVLNK